MGVILDSLSRWIVRQLERPIGKPPPYAAADPDALRAILQPADVILVDGGQKVSVAIQYLTQSTWSHAALYVGDALAGRGGSGEEPRDLIEVEIMEGCHATSLDRYRDYSLRICRPFGLAEAERARVVEFMVARLGLHYDTKNVVDLARYLFPTPPVPVRWRRRMIALGSGDPSRAICSSLIAQAFQSVDYPVLPEVESIKQVRAGSSGYSRSEIWHIRHHSLYTPRDFDLSPYFAIVKPTVEARFDYRQINWSRRRREP